MLPCIPYDVNKVVDFMKSQDTLTLQLQKGKIKIVPVDGRSIRVMYTKKDFFSDDKENPVRNIKPGLIDLPAFSDFEVKESEDLIILSLPELIVEIDRSTGTFTYFDRDENGKKGRLLVKEGKRAKELEEFPVFKVVESSIEKEVVETADGKKEVVRDAGKVQTGTAYHTWLRLNFDEDEALYGLGQQEEGFGSLRGKKVFLHQGNRKIAIPVLVSVKGYGFMINTYSPAIFSDTDEGSYFYTEADEEMDFFFMNGKNPDGVVKEYRKITGKATLLPKWAFGYIQSQERYETQEEILSVAKKYREKKIGLDCIVLDWLSWDDNCWGQKSFDKKRFPDTDAMTKELHDNHVHFMISIWPNMAEITENHKEMKAAGLMLPGYSLYDAFKKEARELYWKQADKGLFKHGVDAWWCDNSEPIAPEWMRPVRPDSTKMYYDYVNATSEIMPATETNAYGLYHAMGIYEGQRSVTDEKRVTNLTRSGYLGQQRYGTILWSGDISASWDTLQRQIPAGVHFCASGMPYWTVDIGAFFVKNGINWYWDGEYDDGPKDPAYCELFTRWYQWAAFLPVFRGHGTDFRRELWEFDNPAAPFYDALLKANRVRYELMPYIYSAAGKVWLEDELIIKPLAYEFYDDRNTWNILDQYMFGESMMVCPVTKPMYFTDKANNEKTRRVYLPEGCGWYEYFTERFYEGGQWIEAAAELDHIPVFVREGSIIPKTEAALSTEEQTGEITYNIYAGKDAEYILYEDKGDGYGYEKGEYTLTTIRWDDKAKVLSPGNVKSRVICKA